MCTPTRRPSWALWRCVPNQAATTCAPQHSRGLSVPRGWEVIRLPGDLSTPRASTDDLMALADAVRRAGFGVAEPEPIMPPVARRKGHLAVLADPEDTDG